MVEKNIIVSDITLTHKGLFSTKELEQFFKKTVALKGFELSDESHDIKADPANKQITIKQTYKKVTSEYDTSIIVVKLSFTHLTHTYVMRDGQKRASDKGIARISFTGKTASTKEGFIGYTPFKYFIYFIRSKFITKKHDTVAGIHLEDEIKEIYDELFLYTRSIDWKEIEKEDSNDS